MKGTFGARIVRNVIVVDKPVQMLITGMAASASYVVKLAMKIMHGAKTVRNVAFAAKFA